jgi:glycosyltransferase involved in cell wall biosynthesis
VSHDVKEKYSSLGIGVNSKWVVINPGIRISHSSGYKKLLYSNLSPKTVQIVWVGRFAEVKNPKLAIEVYKLLQINSEFNFELTMIGDGALLNSCKKYAQEENLGVNFTGWLTDVTEKLFKSDILIFTSENEGFGMVVVEAALSEALVVSTQSGGVLDFIYNEQTGLLAEANAESFAEAIIGVCKHEDKFKEIILNARNLATANFSADSYIEKHLDLYRKVILRNTKA